MSIARRYYGNDTAEHRLLNEIQDVRSPEILALIAKSEHAPHSVRVAAIGMINDRELLTDIKENAGESASIRIAAEEQMRKVSLPFFMADR